VHEQLSTITTRLDEILLDQVGEPTFLAAMGSLEAEIAAAGGSIVAAIAASEAASVAAIAAQTTAISGVITAQTTAIIASQAATTAAIAGLATLLQNTLNTGFADVVSAINNLNSSVNTINTSVNVIGTAVNLSNTRLTAIQTNTNSISVTVSSQTSQLSTINTGISNILQGQLDGTGNSVFKYAPLSGSLSTLSVFKSQEPTTGKTVSVFVSPSSVGGDLTAFVDPDTKLYLGILSGLTIDPISGRLRVLSLPG